MDIRTVHTEADYKAALKEISALMAADPELGTPEGNRLEVLTTLVQAYEARHEKVEPSILFINVRYGNQASLDETYDAMADNFDDLTWRELLEDVLQHDLGEQVDLQEWLMENFGIEPDDLDNEISDEASDRFYSDICYQQDNITGGPALAFNLIRSLELFPMDKDGNGGANGVSLVQTTANGPAKHVFIQDEKAAQWLSDQLRLKGLDVAVEFV